MNRCLQDVHNQQNEDQEAVEQDSLVNNQIT